MYWGREEERFAKKECVKEQGRGEIGKVSTMRLGREVKERHKQITAGAFPVALGLHARARVPALLRVVVAHSSLRVSNGSLLSTLRKDRTAGLNIVFAYTAFPPAAAMCTTTLTPVVTAVTVLCYCSSDHSPKTRRYQKKCSFHFE